MNLKTGAPSASAVRRGYDAVSMDPRLRARAGEIGAALRTAGGAPRAAELLESFAEESAGR